MRCSIYRRDLQQTLGRRKLIDITESDIRSLCDKIVDRSAPAVAVHVRDILLQVFNWANLRGEKIEIPASAIAPTSIARFKPRERNLTPHEIKIAIESFDDVGANVAIKAGTKLLMLTFVRKSELANATWDEIDFNRSLWTIPAARMKKRKPHIVPLSSQAIDILVALKTLAGSSDYVLPGRYDSTKPISNATFNRFFQQIADAARKRGKQLEDFGPHDLRRTASTLLHEAGFSSDWIEKQLAHEQCGVRAVYNKAQYLEQRRQMMQSWADMIDAYCDEIVGATSPSLRRRELRRFAEVSSDPLRVALHPLGVGFRTGQLRRAHLGRQRQRFFALDPGRACAAAQHSRETCARRQREQHPAHPARQPSARSSDARHQLAEQQLATVLLASELLHGSLQEGSRQRRRPRHR